MTAAVSTKASRSRVEFLAERLDGHSRRQVGKLIEAMSFLQGNQPHAGNGGDGGKASQWDKSIDVDFCSADCLASKCRS